MKKLFQSRWHPDDGGRLKGCLFSAIVIIFIFAIQGSGTAHAQTAERDTSSAEQNNYPEYSLAELYKIALERSERVQISGEDLVIAERFEDVIRVAKCAS